MKTFFILLLLGIGVFAQREEKKIVEKQETKKEETDKVKEKENEKGGSIDFDKENDYGNPDIYGLIERPCPEYDRFCIRGFFAKNSNCKIVPGPVEEPFYVTELQIYLSEINTTTTTNDSILRGLNGLILDFYINKATGNLVLSVFFDNLSTNSRQVYYRFFRNGREPVERSDVTVIDYKKLTVTIVIPNYKNLQLDNAEITGYLDDPFPPFFIGPRVAGATDPTAQAAIQSLNANVPAAAKANLLTVAPLAGKIFVQKNICDFGVPVNKVGFN